MVKIKIWQKEIYRDIDTNTEMQQVAINIQKDVDWQNVSLQIPLRTDIIVYNRILSEHITEALNKLLVGIEAKEK